MGKRTVWSDLDLELAQQTLRRLMSRNMDFTARELEALSEALERVRSVRVTSKEPLYGTHE